LVPGSARLFGVAREVSRATAGGNADAGEGVRRWFGHLAMATLLVAALAIPLRGVIAAMVGVDEAWGAAAVPVTAMLWTLLCVERGALQGFGRYRAVGTSIVAEAASRLVFALALVGLGLDVTGAFLGSALALVAVGAALAVPLHDLLPPRHGGTGLARLRDLLADARAPVIGLTLLFVLQEVHVIVVKHQASDDAAGSYAVAAVAAKAIVWVAVGLGLYLLPETARRGEAGVDARPILLRTLGLIGLCAVPMMLIFGFGAEQLLEAVFGEDLTESADALPWLGLAMTLLACSYLAVQYLLGIGRWRFIWVLAVAAASEIGLLAAIGADLEQVGMALFAVQLCCAAAMAGVAFRATGSGYE
jgi:O-antigen/teichoic acid export membrane protein